MKARAEPSLASGASAPRARSLTMHHSKVKPLSAHPLLRRQVPWVAILVLALLGLSYQLYISYDSSTAQVSRLTPSQNHRATRVRTVVKTQTSTVVLETLIVTADAPAATVTVEKEVQAALDTVTLEKAERTVTVGGAVQTDAFGNTQVAFMKYEDTKPSFKPGIPEPHKEYRKALTVASIAADNMTWLDIHLPDMEHYVYVNDDPEAEYTVPMNKGNEVMTYLTFLIDHYDKLPETMLFVHAHEATHHNPWLLHTSMPEMAKAISPQRIVREGYMNMHCGAWALGDCPAGIRPAQGLPFTEHKQAWEELFPQYPIPVILAQSCCAQFAVSRERVLQIPREDFIRYRQWLLDTDMPNRISGYIWEYLWQFIFKGEHVYCPPQDECYCDGYGVCMREKQFKDFNNLYFASLHTRDEIDRIDRIEKEGIKEDPKYALPKVEQERRENLATVLDETREVMFGMRDAAFERGKDPQVRAAAAHLKWEDGDGFV